MKKITISIDDETHCKVRIAAASRGVSIASIVREYLAVVAGEAAEFEQLKRAQCAVQERIAAFRASDRSARDELHDRKS